jgi:hypothetical protein
MLSLLCFTYYLIEKPEVRFGKEIINKLEGNIGLSADMNYDRVANII